MDRLIIDYIIDALDDFFRKLLVGAGKWTVVAVTFGKVRPHPGLLPTTKLVALGILGLAVWILLIWVVIQSIERWS